MKVFVAGASGAIGSYLVPQLIEGGHDVVGTAKSTAGADRILAHGAEPAVLNLLDPKAVRQAVLAARPDAIIHEGTAISGVKFSRNMDRSFAETNRLRTEGTDNLLAAAREVGVRRFIAQSFASLRYERSGGPIKTEDDPLEPNVAPTMRQAEAAMRHVEKVVVEAGGIALRYGGFYGAASDALPEPVRKRQLPIIGNGAGITSFIHLEDAAAATVLALDHGEPGIYNIVDDTPAPMNEWLPELAKILGAKPPRRMPVWVARLFAGDLGEIMGTTARGVSNAKAKRELGWTLRYPNWRQGFAAAYAPTAAKADSIPQHSAQTERVSA